MDLEATLIELRDRITAYDLGWVFPSESRVRGFMGLGPVFLVGDQPSESEWSETHPNRRLFYDTVADLGLGSAHLTDVYKRRGRSNELRKGLPLDFSDHVALFR